MNELLCEEPDVNFLKARKVYERRAESLRAPRLIKFRAFFLILDRAWVRVWEL